MDLETYRLEMEGFSKLFPGVKALDNVDLRIRPGSVHALIGENGAGKSTLMKCLFGMYKEDMGTFKIDGKPIEINSTQDALNQGISMIHQELNPIPHTSITDNIWVGRFEKKGFVIDEKKMHQKTKELLAHLDLNMDPDTLLKDLSVSQQQSIEIAKAISYDAKIIIMDEPTSSLTRSETEKLFKIIQQLRDEGRSVIYISHKLEELFQICDEATVLRDGKYVGCWQIQDLTIEKLIEYMIGRDLEERFPEQEVLPTGDKILEVKGFTSANQSSFKDVSFDLYSGEILGVGGLVGAQRTELVESLFGLHPVSAGELYLKGEKIENSTPDRAIEHGFALVTEDRRATGIFPMLSVVENTLVAAYNRFTKPPFGVIKRKKADKAALDVCQRMNVKTPSMETLIQTLSGGNQQKVLLGRWLLTDSHVIILDEPTRGVDVGAKYEIYKLIRDLAKQGAAIIMVSSEMPELIGMSDRIMVMCNGKMTGILDKSRASQGEIMKLATKF